MPSEVEIARAAPDESSDVRALLARQFEEHGNPLDPAGLERSVGAALGDGSLGFFLLARSKRTAVGVAYVAFTWALEHGGKTAWLEELYVLPEWRNGGVGRMMLVAGLEEARRQGCAAVDLEVAADHARAEHLYRRNGFVPLPRNRWVRRFGD